MKTNFRAAFLAALLCTGQNTAIAKSNPVELKWEELSPLINGHKATLELMDGVKVRGEVVATRPDSILLDVSAPAGEIAPGNGPIPRSSIRLIHVERSRGGWGRAMGTVLGVMGGIVVGSYIALQTDSAGAAIPIFLGIASGIGVGGYHAGKLLDKRVMHIRVIP